MHTVHRLCSSTKCQQVCFSFSAIPTCSARSPCDPLYIPLYTPFLHTCTCHFYYDFLLLFHQFISSYWLSAPSATQRRRGVRCDLRHVAGFTNRNVGRGNNWNGHVEIIQRQEQKIPCAIMANDVASTNQDLVKDHDCFLDDLITSGATAHLPCKASSLGILHHDTTHFFKPGLAKF